MEKGGLYMKDITEMISSELVKEFDEKTIDRDTMWLIYSNINVATSKNYFNDPKTLRTEWRCYDGTLFKTYSPYC